jgi:hypothetical protein
MTVEPADLNVLFHNSLALDGSQWTSLWSPLGSADWNASLRAATSQDHGAPEGALPCSDPVILLVVETKAVFIFSQYCYNKFHMPIGCQNSKRKFESENNFCLHCYPSNMVIFVIYLIFLLHFLTLPHIFLGYSQRSVTNRSDQVKHWLCSNCNYNNFMNNMFTHSYTSTPYKKSLVSVGTSQLNQSPKIEQNIISKWFENVLIQIPEIAGYQT